MRSFFKMMALGVFFILLFGVVVALAIHWAGALDGVAVSIDDQRFDGPMTAIAIGGITALALMVAFVVVATVLACVAIIVPLALALAALAVLLALFFGLAPLLVPVLLVVGACVLLARWIRRPRSAPPSGGAPI